MCNMRLDSLNVYQDNSYLSICKPSVNYLYKFVRLVYIAYRSQKYRNQKLRQFYFEPYPLLMKNDQKSFIWANAFHQCIIYFKHNSKQKMRSKAVIVLFIGILYLSAAQNLQESRRPQEWNHQPKHPMVGQEQFNPYPYEVYSPFQNQNDEYEQKNIQECKERESVNTYFLYGLVLGTAIISFILVKKCCCTRNEQMVRAINSIRTPQPQRFIPEGRIYYSEPRGGVINAQNQLRSPIVPMVQQRNVYPTSALDKQIQFHKKQIEKLQKQKEDVQNQEIKKREQQQKMLVQKQRQQQIQKQQELDRQKMMMNEQRSLPNSMQTQNNYYGYQNYQHPMIRNQPVIYQPEILEKRNPKIESAGYIQIGKKAGKQIEPIPKRDNDSSFASQYPQI